MGEGLKQPCPKIVRGQQQLTPEQKAYAREFARERLAAVFSTEACSEQEIEAHLLHVYRTAGAELPFTIRWFDSPFAFAQACVPYFAQLRAQLDRHNCSRDCLDDCRLNEGARVHIIVASSGVDVKVWTAVGKAALEANVLTSVQPGVWSSEDASTAASVLISMEAAVGNSRDVSAAGSVQIITGAGVAGRVGELVGECVWHHMQNHMKTCQRSIVGASVAAFSNARVLGLYRFFHEMFEENKLINLALLNEMVSGYRLGEREAWVVRKPTLLERDEQGRLHCASGPCIQYRDGWGFYAWHGVRVSEKLILHPEQMTREDWLITLNIEVRRAIQERLGNERFIDMVGGKQIDTGRRGKLIEIDLGRYDPERVAHYVQVQDSSTERQYYLRVPPSINSADEAIAWTFGVTEAEYQPGQET